MDSTTAAIPLSLTICIVFVVSGLWFKTYKEKHNQNAWCHESAISAICGLIVGFVIKVSFGRAVIFDSELFFYLVLPPIIFSAGYSLKRKRFFRYGLSITVFGIFGTVLSVMMTTLAAHSFCDIFNADERLRLGWPQSMLLASILSASDEVSAMSMVRMKDYPRLGALIFGEGVLNDVLSIVLFKSVLSFIRKGTGRSHHHHHSTTTTISDGSNDDEESPAQFLEIATIISITVVIQIIASLLIGLFCGLSCSRFLKSFSQSRRHPVHQTALVLLFGLLSYSMAESFGVSGILTLFVAAVTLAHYSWHSLSKSSQISTKISFLAMSDIAEGFAFAYVGLSMWQYTSDYVSILFSVYMLITIIIVRVITITGICLFCKKLHKDFDLPLREQFAFCLGGLVRGCLCWAQVLQVADQSLMVTTTLFIVLFTTITSGFFFPIIMPALVSDGKSTSSTTNHQKLVTAETDEYNSSSPFSRNDHSAGYGTASTSGLTAIPNDSTDNTYHNSTDGQNNSQNNGQQQNNGYNRYVRRPIQKSVNTDGGDSVQTTLQTLVSIPYKRNIYGNNNNSNSNGNDNSNGSYNYSKISSSNNSNVSHNNSDYKNNNNNHNASNNYPFAVTNSGDTNNNNSTNNSSNSHNNTNSNSNNISSSSNSNNSDFANAVDNWNAYKPYQNGGYTGCNINNNISDGGANISNNLNSGNDGHNFVVTNSINFPYQLHSHSITNSSASAVPATVPTTTTATTTTTTTTTELTIALPTASTCSDIMIIPISVQTATDSNENAANNFSLSQPPPYSPAVPLHQYPTAQSYQQQQSRSPISFRSSHISGVGTGGTANDTTTALTGGNNSSSGISDVDEPTDHSEQGQETETEQHVPLYTVLFILWVRFDERVMKPLFGGSSVTDGARLQILQSSENLRRTGLCSMTSPVATSTATARTESPTKTTTSHDSMGQNDNGNNNNGVGVNHSPRTINLSSSSSSRSRSPRLSSSNSGIARNMIHTLSPFRQSATYKHGYRQIASSGVSMISNGSRDEDDDNDNNNAENDNNNNNNKEIAEYDDEYNDDYNDNINDNNNHDNSPIKQLMSAIAEEEEENDKDDDNDLYEDSFIQTIAAEDAAAEEQQQALLALKLAAAAERSSSERGGMRNSRNSISRSRSRGRSRMKMSSSSSSATEDKDEQSRRGQKQGRRCVSDSRQQRVSELHSLQYDAQSKLDNDGNDDDEDEEIRSRSMSSPFSPYPQLQSPNNNNEENYNFGNHSVNDAVVDVEGQNNTDVDLMISPRSESNSKRYSYYTPSNNNRANNNESSGSNNNSPRVIGQSKTTQQVLISSVPLRTQLLLPSSPPPTLSPIQQQPQEQQLQLTPILQQQTQDDTGVALTTFSQSSK